MTDATSNDEDNNKITNYIEPPKISNININLLNSI